MADQQQQLGSDGSIEVRWGGAGSPGATATTTSTRLRKLSATTRCQTSATQTVRRRGAKAGRQGQGIESSWSVRRSSEGAEQGRNKGRARDLRGSVPPLLASNLNREAARQRENRVGSGLVQWRDDRPYCLRFARFSSPIRLDPSQVPVDLASMTRAGTVRR